jgi:hypothetical protein
MVPSNEIDKITIAIIVKFPIKPPIAKKIFSNLFSPLKFFA